MSTFENYLNTPLADDSYATLFGDYPALITAPHAVEQTRNGAAKWAEPGTGALARMLHDDPGCFALVKTQNCGDDANDDESSGFRDDAVRLVNENGIKFGLDLHQVSPDREEMIDVGNGCGANVEAFPNLGFVVVESFDEQGFGNLSVDKLFPAQSPNRVSSTLSRECGIACVQIEINTRLVSPEFDEFAPDRVFEALRGVVLQLC